MSIDIEREGRGCVANIMLDGFDIVAILQGQHSIGVSQVVKTGFRKANCCHDLLKMFVHGIRAEISSRIAGKNQIQRVAPVFSCQTLFFLLSEQTFLKDVHNKSRWSDSAQAIIFGAYQPILSSSALDSFLLELLINSDKSRFKIHAIPTQAQNFALSHSGKQINLVNHFKRMTAYSRKECLDFCFLQEGYLVRLDSGQHACIRRITRDVSQQNRSLQCAMQNAMDVFDGFCAQTFRLCCGFHFLIIKSLNDMRAQLIQSDTAQGRFYMVFQIAPILTRSGRLYVPKIFRTPNIQPLSNRHSVRFGISSIVHARNDRTELFPAFRSTFPIYRLRNRLPGSWINTDNSPSLPATICSFPWL